MIHIVTGGSGSGKSAYAEEQIVNMGQARRIYVATMHPFDEESIRRIHRHREMRKDKEFDTIECYCNLKSVVIPEQKPTNILLECMSNLVANEMYEEAGAGNQVVQAVLDGIEHLTNQADNLVIVTNEIASDVQDYSQETMDYIRYLGEINAGLAKMADQVTEVVYGIPIELKKYEGMGEKE